MGRAGPPCLQRRGGRSVCTVRAPAAATVAAKPETPGGAADRPLPGCASVGNFRAGGRGRMADGLAGPAAVRKDGRGVCAGNDRHFCTGVRQSVAAHPFQPLYGAAASLDRHRRTHLAGGPPDARLAGLALRAAAACGGGDLPAGPVGASPLAGRPADVGLVPAAQPVFALEFCRRWQVGPRWLYRRQGKGDKE